MAKTKSRELLLPIITILAIHTYIIASWAVWWYGGGYGHRAFIDAFTLFAIPLGFTFAKFEKKYWKRLLAIVLILILLNIFKEYQFVKEIFAGDGPGIREYFRTFFQI